MLAGCSVPAHVDINEEEPSYVFVFCTFTGGQLHVERADGVECSKPELLKWHRVEARQRHWVSEVETGTRFSVVVYTPARAEHMSQEAFNELERLGFPVVSWRREYEKRHKTGLTDVSATLTVAPGSCVADSGSGCQSTAGGKHWHEEFQAVLMTWNLPWFRIPQREHFRFGAGPLTVSSEGFIYPVRLPNGEVLSVFFAQVPTERPGLLSSTDMGRAKIMLDFGEGVLCMPGYTQPLQRAQHPVVQLACWDVETVNSCGGASFWTESRRKDSERGSKRTWII
eukprot:6473193-Amphidinium_carterae.1